MHIAPIYQAFESLWDLIIEARRLPRIANPKATNNFSSLAVEVDCPAPRHLSKMRAASLPFEAPTPFSAGLSAGADLISPELEVCRRLQDLLADLRLDGLLRTNRLIDDIHKLTSTPVPTILTQMVMISSSGVLSKFTAHIDEAVRKSPHILVAYAWVLYMALFSGGRHLRAVLRDSGGGPADFWSRDPSPVRPYSVFSSSSSVRRRSVSDPTDPIIFQASRPLSRSASQSTQSSILDSGLSFFDFEGYEDGEDIKRVFKRRIAEAEGLLTEGEKEDIIKEARVIFGFMLEMVGVLDEVCGNTGEEEVSRPSRLFITRDSVALEKERRSTSESSAFGE